MRATIRRLRARNSMQPSASPRLFAAVDGVPTRKTSDCLGRTCAAFGLQVPVVSEARGSPVDGRASMGAICELPSWAGHPHRRTFHPDALAQTNLQNSPQITPNLRLPPAGQFGINPLVNHGAGVVQW